MQYAMDGKSVESGLIADCDAKWAHAARTAIARSADQSPCFQQAHQHYMMLGICGTGIRAFCELLLDAGHSVTGSDSQLQSSAAAVSEEFQWRNARVRILPCDDTPGFIYSHSVSRDAGPREGALNFNSPNEPLSVSSATSLDSIRFDFSGRKRRMIDAVVASNAVPDHDPGIIAARTQGLPVFRLTQALCRMLTNHQQLCIAGTHGKTTSTAMLWSVLSQNNLASAAFIGGSLAREKRSGFWQTPVFKKPELASWAVVESCEYRNAFSNLNPTGMVLTGIERDHFDCFPTQETEDLVFDQFAEKLPNNGFLSVNADCRRAMRIANRVQRAAKATVITFGFCESAAWTATNLQPSGGGIRFCALYRGRQIGTVWLRVPGRHNVLNALASISAGHHLGLAFDRIADALEDFRGVCRRFENRGQWNGMQLVDDYAHHPTAIQATLDTARQLFPGKRLIAIFEPHQLSRVEQLFDEFGNALEKADECMILPVLPARELSTRAMCCRTSGRLVRSINLAGGRAFLLADLDQVIGRIDHSGRPGDVVITMGAGRTYQIHDEFNRRLQRDFVA